MVGDDHTVRTCGNHRTGGIDGLDSLDHQWAPTRTAHTAQKGTWIRGGVTERQAIHRSGNIF